MTTLRLVEYVAVGLGFVYLLFAIRAQRACWIFGGVSSALFGIVFARSGLHLQAALQVLYVALAVVGWIRWGRDGQPLRADGPRAWRVQVALLAVVLAGTGILAPLVAGIRGATEPLLDTATTLASLAATWLLIRRSASNWLWWIVIDVAIAVLCWRGGLYGSSALYAAFTVLAAYGWWRWRREATTR